MGEVFARCWHRARGLCWVERQENPTSELPTKRGCGRRRSARGANSSSPIALAVETTSLILGGPRTLTGDQVEAVLVAVLELTPVDATHWSRVSMAKESGLSKSTVGRIWKVFGLKPHLIDIFKISNDPQFIKKVCDVVMLYLGRRKIADSSSG